MLCEPTTLATVPLLIGQTLENNYQIDPRPIFSALMIETQKISKPGARISFAKMDKLWERAVEVTGDPMFGLKVGRNARPSDFYVLGHAWLASASLLGSMQRLCRYAKILSTEVGELYIERHEDSIALVETFPDRERMPPKVARDGGYASLMNMCEFVKRRPVYPVAVSLMLAADDSSNEYDKLFRCPITYGTDADKFFFVKGDLEEPLSGSIPEVADATDSIAANYIASFDKNSVATEIRQMIIQMLPSGRVDQETVSDRLYRSRSTLQRQLKGEGTTYREILESTRQSLAEQYLKDGAYSQAQIAFMTGFADQSNFARAFKRWTGVSPGQFQKVA
jgi:AraC-like DNA-binding protein